ncbi:MAG: M20/M25/M40 family metallo-hydrolase [Bryobacteraceae bacterium]|nr:M20/M25/M40 family metallo-hydrolase [Bryobacteraceae bacterium]
MRFLPLLWLLPLAAQDVSAPRLRAHVKFLSSDLLEGRGVGTRGGRLATEYLAAAFAAAGAQPAGDLADGRRTYAQQVLLRGVTTLPSSSINAGDTTLTYLTDFVGASQRQRASEDLRAPVIFVGHGIHAPEFRWNDYAGVDVRGKIVVLFTNEPPSEDERFFGGRALTYYGRWAYKFQEAARQGALACLIVHTDSTAGYSWEVVRNSWGKEDTQIPASPATPSLAFAGWLTSNAAAKLLSIDVKELLTAADQRGFRARPLDAALRIQAQATLRDVRSENVAAMVEGTDLAQEAVIFSAHWDHLGINPQATGDGIYNGAVDNATGLAVVLELARAWAALPQKPRRTALFLAVTAEEGGLRGSEYYSRHPLIPLGKTQLNLNFDAIPPYGRPRDLVVSGAERTTAWPLVQEVARRYRFAISPDPHPEQGSYYRSDHFSFARAGVPAFSVNLGADYQGVNAARATAWREGYGKHYHQPSDEFREDWDWSGVEEVARVGLTLGINAANNSSLYTWRPNDEFLPARNASWR